MKINILQLKKFPSTKLSTCKSDVPFMLTSICKHTDHLENSDYFLDETGQYSHEAIRAHKILISKTPQTNINSYSHQIHSSQSTKQSYPHIISSNLKKTWAELSSIAFPKQPDFVALVTGTDGKTSTAWITYQTWQKLGIKSGYIGTLGIMIDDKKFKANLTTPDASELHYFLNEMKNHGINHVVIEASSIGLDQDRLAFIKADIAIFTTFSQDHLDYHKSLKHYFDSKIKITENLKSSSSFIIHHSVATHPEFQRYNQQINKSHTLQNVVTYGKPTPYYATQQNLQHVSTNNSQQNWLFNITNSHTISSNNIQHQHINKQFKITNQLRGDFNGDNMIASYFILSKSGIADEKIFAAFNALQPVPGRINMVCSFNQSDIFVDFAHTPYALQNILQSLNKTYQKITLIFGCGGNRDKEKRALMGKIANEICENVIITNDNPRSEDPNDIAQEIHNACPNAKIILDRKEAIEYGIQNLQPGSALLVAGKGDENEQIFATHTEKFHDASIIKHIIEDN